MTRWPDADVHAAFVALELSVRYRGCAHSMVDVTEYGGPTTMLCVLCGAQLRPQHGRWVGFVDPRDMEAGK